MAGEQGVRFRAYFPAIQSAIKVDGGGNGMRIQLDISEVDLPKALDLLMWRGRVLSVFVEPADPVPVPG